MQPQELTDFIRVSKYLNKPRVILGMTMDECMPAATSLFFGVMSGIMAWGTLFAFAWVMGLKTLKRYRNPQFLRICVYWFFGKQISGLAFKNTLDSAKRFWLK